MSEPLMAEAIAETEHGHGPTDAPRAPARGVRRDRLATIAAVSAGGFLGANARYLVGLWAADRFGTAFPWGTLLINVSGSFVLGFYLTLATERFVGRSTTRLFLATGFLGAYTTFSTFSYETVQMAAAGAVLPAAGYVAGSLLLGIAAAVAGILGAHAL
jgi:CrcB protein